MSAEGAEQAFGAKQVSAPWGLKKYCVSFHALTDVATKSRPFGPKIILLLNDAPLKWTNESSLGLVQRFLKYVFCVLIEHNFVSRELSF